MINERERKGKEDGLDLEKKEASLFHLRFRRTLALIGSIEADTLSFPLSEAATTTSATPLPPPHHTVQPSSIISRSCSNSNNTRRLPPATSPSLSQPSTSQSTPSQLYSRSIQRDGTPSCTSRRQQPGHLADNLRGRSRSARNAGAVQRWAGNDGGGSAVSTAATAGANCWREAGLDRDSRSGGQGSTTFDARSEGGVQGDQGTDALASYGTRRPSPKGLHLVCPSSSSNPRIADIARRIQ